MAHVLRKNPGVWLVRPLAPESIEAFDKVRRRIADAVHSQSYQYTERHAGTLALLTDHEISQHGHFALPGSVAAGKSDHWLAQKVYERLPASAHEPLRNVPLKSIIPRGSEFNPSLACSIDDPLIVSEFEVARAALIEVTGVDRLRNSTGPHFSFGKLVNTRGQTPEVAYSAFQAALTAEHLGTISLGPVISPDRARQQRPA